MTEEEFDRILAEGWAVVALFTAPSWCVPCQRLEPHWEKVCYSDSMEWAVFLTIDMGTMPEDTGDHWATKRFGIKGVPSIKLFLPANPDPIDIKARAAIPLIKELNNV